MVAQLITDIKTNTDSVGSLLSPGSYGSGNLTLTDCHQLLENGLPLYWLMHAVGFQGKKDIYKHLVETEAVTIAHTFMGALAARQLELAEVCLRDAGEFEMEFMIYSFMATLGTEDSAKKLVAAFPRFLSNIVTGAAYAGKEDIVNTLLATVTNKDLRKAIELDCLRNYALGGHKALVAGLTTHESVSIAIKALASTGQFDDAKQLQKAFGLPEDSYRDGAETGGYFDSNAVNARKNKQTLLSLWSNCIEGHHIPMLVALWDAADNAVKIELKEILFNLASPELLAQLARHRPSSADKYSLYALMAEFDPEILAIYSIPTAQTNLSITAKLPELFIQTVMTEINAEKIKRQAFFRQLEKSDYNLLHLITYLESHPARSEISQIVVAHLGFVQLNKMLKTILAEPKPPIYDELTAAVFTQINGALTSKQLQKKFAAFMMQALEESTNQSWALNQLLRHGSLKTIEIVLDKKFKKKWLSEVLLTAAELGRSDVLAHLITVHHVDIDVSTYPDRWTALILASEQGHTETVKWLLAQKTIGHNKKYINATAENGLSALYIAAQTGYADIVKLLLDAGANVNNPDTVRNSTPLLQAAQNGHVEVVKRLLQDPTIDVNTKRSDGVTPLFIAAELGHVEIVKCLLEKGANPAVTHKENLSTPLIQAAQKGHALIVELLLNDPRTELNCLREDNATALLLAAQGGYVAICKALLDAGAEFDWSNPLPMLLAAEKGYTDIIWFFVNPLNVNASTPDGRTALFIAAQKGNVESAELLLKNGASISSKATLDITPLAIAANNGHAAIVALFLKWDKSIAEQDKVLALSLAIYCGHHEVAQVLMEHCENIDAINDVNVTPLILAVYKNDLAMVELLLAHNAKPDFKIKFGIDALKVAEQKGHHEIAALLRAKLEPVDHDISPLILYHQHNNDAAIARCLQHIEDQTMAIQLQCEEISIQIELLKKSPDFLYFRGSIEGPKSKDRKLIKECSVYST